MSVLCELRVESFSCSYECLVSFPDIVKFGVALYLPLAGVFSMIAMRARVEERPWIVDNGQRAMKSEKVISTINSPLSIALPSGNFLLFR